MPPAIPKARSNHQPFALSLLGVIADRTEGNVCISPASLDAALRVVAEGMTEPTRNATLRQLGPSAGPIEPQDGSGYQLAHGTALYHDSHIALLPAYEQQVRAMGAHLEHCPGELYKAKDIINAFISNNTLGIFHDAISEDFLATQHSLLVDALGFKGTWEDEFRARSTRSNYDFFASPSRTMKCNMMFSYRSRVSVSESATHLGVSLPYKRQGLQPHASFWAFMPKEGSTMDAMLLALKRDGFPTILGREKLERLGLPKFKMRQTHGDLHSLLQQTGIDTLQTPLFVTKKDCLVIQAAVQAVSIEVHEKGTVAAALTVMVPAPPTCARTFEVLRDIIFDRPFAYFLRIGSNPGHVLFAGIFAEAQDIQPT